MVIVGVCRMYDVRKGKLHLPLCLQIYKEGLPSIVMQSLYTLYIVGLNLILKQLTEDAVTVLGIYYKVQAFFFIPLMGLQRKTCGPHLRERRVPGASTPFSRPKRKKRALSRLRPSF